MSIETDLKKEKVSRLDLHEFTKVESGAKIRDVVEKMNQGRHNCALVTKKGELIGIFTERDVLYKIATEPSTWDRPIDEFMTPSPKTTIPNGPSGDALNLMTTGHFRNVPVVDKKGKIRGNVSQYAFIKFLADHFPQQVYNLSPDDGIHQDRYGG